MYFVQNSYIVNVTYLDLRGVDMGAMSKKEFTTVSSYDDSLWDRYSLYDNMPFVWDTDLNVERIFTYVSGNLIKSYRCNMKEPYEVKH